MDFYGFIKSSTAMDLVFIMLVILSSLGLIVAAIVMLFAAKTRRPLYVIAGLAILPLVLALIGGAWRMHTGEQLIAQYHETDAEVLEAYHGRVHRDLMIMVVMGLVGSALPALIGIAGAVKKPAAAAPSQSGTTT
jgi:hypothetical protein